MTEPDPPPATEPRRRLGDHPSVAAVRGAAPWLVPTVLIVIAGVLLINRLHLPLRIIFDETYYVNDALSFLQTGGVEDSFAVHPPVGKWLIAAGIQVFGDNAVGWRLPGALAGLAMVHLTYLLGLRLLHSRGLAFVAGLLLATDGLFLVQARTSMLDIFLAFFVLLGAWLLVRDLQDLDRRSRTAGGLAARGIKDRWLAGLAFGLAIGTKWSGLLALGATLVLVVGFEIIAHRRSGRRGVGARRLLWVTVGPLLLLPAFAYLVTYIPWMAAYEHTTEGKEDCPGAAEGEVECDATVGDRLAGLVREHQDILRFHRNLESTHSYRAEPWTWPVLGRPVAYYYETCKADRVDEDPCEVDPGMAAEVLALGNPATWWSFALALPLLASAMGRRNPTAWIIGGFYGGQFLPWLAVSRPAFLFYMVPAIPFIALGLALALGILRARPRDPLPWLAGFGAGGTAAIATWMTGASKPAIGIAFGIGWTFAPLVIAAVWDAVQARQRAADLVLLAALEEAEDGDEAGHEGADGATTPVAEATAPTTEVAFTPWWPSRPLWAAADHRAGWIAGGVLLLAVVACLVFFLPVWTGVPMDPDLLNDRWWFRTWI